MTFDFSQFKEIPLRSGLLESQFTMNPGDRVAIVGQNGIGKSSFIQFLKYRQDQIFSNFSIGHLEQFPMAPLGSLRAKDAFELLKTLYPQQLLKSSLNEHVLFHQWKFSDKLERPINSLSGGENQILKILLCFSLNRDVYILDEPTNHLDEIKKNDFIKYLNELNPSISLIIVDHDKTVLQKLCAKGFLMSKKGSEKISIEPISGDGLWK